MDVRAWSNYKVGRCNYDITIRLNPIHCYPSTVYQRDKVANMFLVVAILS